MKILKFNESIIMYRIDNYIKYAKIKYPDLTADEIIEIIDNKNNELAFNSDKERTI